MSMTTISVEETKSAVWLDHVRDLGELSKPRITAMVLVSVALSIFVASSGQPDLLVLLHTLLGSALVAASSSAWNQWIERHRDGAMLRTANRPLPAGRMGGSEVLSFGSVTLIAGVAYLTVTVGWIPAAWAVATWVVYVCVYTPMKSRTSWNTAVGAISGTLPILIGWSAVEAPVNWRLVGMLLVLFFWQFPHFIAIAWIYRAQYEKAGFRMLTGTDPTGRRAGSCAMLGAGLLMIASLLPLLAQLSLTYACLAIVLGTYQAVFAWRFQRELTQQTARHLLRASLIYLPLSLGIIAVQTVT